MVFVSACECVTCVKVSHRFRKLSFGYVSPNLIRSSQVAQRILEQQRDFLFRLGVVEQRVALLVDKRRRI